MTISNHILTIVSDHALHRKPPHLDSVRLATGKVLYEPGDTMRYACFPEHAVLSLLGLTSEGNAAATAMVGQEDLIGLPIVLPVNRAPYQVVVQLTGDALRLPADILRSEFRRDRGSRRPSWDKCTTTASDGAVERL